MEAKYSPVPTISSLLVFVLLVATLTHGQGTRIGFYARSCPRAESIVQSAVRSHYQFDPTVAPGLLRLFFHDCFVNGCDASILVDGADTEKTAGPNRLLRGYEVINDAKSQLEAACPGVVSCADILALAARDSVVLTGGLSWKVLTGRRDGLVSLASDTSNLLGSRDTASVQIQKFADVGLNTQDLVALVGAHTIGTASCFQFSQRLYNFNSTNEADPEIDAAFLPELRALCPQNGDGLRRVGMDTGSVDTFDNSFFENLRSGKGVLESDQNLWTDPSTKNFVQRFLGLRGFLGLKFQLEFGKSMVKMGNIGVKTGTTGEIRKVCSSFNMNYFSVW